MMKKFFKRLFGKSDNDEWQKSFEEWQDAFNRWKRTYEQETKKEFPNHNVLFKISYYGNSEKELLDSVDFKSHAYRLFKVNDDFGSELPSIFIIQLKYSDDDREYTVRTFVDKDIEYAENCAREAFHYLTAEI